VRASDALTGALAGALCGNLVRLPFTTAGGKTAPLLGADIAVIAALVICAVVALRRGHLKLDAVAWAGVAFIGVGLLSALRTAIGDNMSAMQLAFALAYLARWATYFALYVMAAELLDARGAHRVARALEAGLLLFAVFGIVQSLLLPGFAQWVYPESTVYADWDPQGRRLVSTVLDPNYAGALLMLGVLLLGGKVVAGVKVPAWRLLLLLTALVLTLSRSSFLALLVGSTVLVAARGIPKRALKLGIIAAVLVAPVMPRLIAFATSFNKLSLDASALARLVNWGKALRVWSDNPLMGIGFNTYGFVQRHYGWRVRGASTFGLDGGLLFVGALTGIVGIACLGYLLWRVARRGWRTFRDASLDAESRGVGIAAAASVPALLVHSLFVNSLLLPYVMLPCWLLWALPRALAVAPGPDEAELPIGAPVPARLVAWRA
jgi:O-antigen ligase